MKKLLLLLMFWVFFIAWCNTEPKEPNPPLTEKPQIEELPKDEYYFWELVELGADFTFKSIEEATVITGDKEDLREDIVADEGVKYMILKMDITNKQKEAIVFHDRDFFQLIDQEERVYNPTTNIKIQYRWYFKDYFDWKELRPWIKTSATAVYEVPTDSTEFTIEWMDYIIHLKNK